MFLYLPAIIINVEQKQIINTRKFVYEIFGLLSLYILPIKKNHPYDKNIKMQNIFQNVVSQSILT